MCTEKVTNFNQTTTMPNLELNRELLLEFPDYDWDWKRISNIFQTLNIPFEFVEKNINKNWDWKVLSTQISFKFIQKYPNLDWDWQEITSRIFCKHDQKFLEDFVKNYFDKNLDWNLLSKRNDSPWKFEGVSAKFVTLNIDFPWNFDILSKNIDLEVVDTHPKKDWNWNYISRERLKASNLKFILKNFEYITPCSKIFDILKEKLYEINGRKKLAEMVNEIKKFMEF